MEQKANIFNNKLFVFIALTVSVFAIYFHTINYPFYFDDFENISNNPKVAIRQLSITTLKDAAFNNNIAVVRPVAYTTFALNYYFNGLNTAPYRIVNIITHILCGFLIYLIICLMFDPSSENKEGSGRVYVAAFFTALIWLSHPLNSQPVIYIVQRMTLLMTLFYLLSFYLYLLWKKRGGKLHFILAFLAFALSLLSKEAGATLPVVILLYELVFTYKGDFKALIRNEKLLACMIAVAMILVLTIYSGKISDSIVKGYARRDFSMGERLLTQFRVLVLYITLLIVPLPGRLSITHNILKSTSLISPVTTLLSMLLVATMFFGAVLRMKKTPYLSFAILWYFITIFIESSFLPLEMMYEHRAYLPSVFLIGVFTDFVIRILYEKKYPVAIVSLCGIALLFGGASYARGGVWSNGISLWKNAMQKDPESGRIYMNLGVVYYRQGKYQEAINHYRLAAKKWEASTNMATDVSKAYYYLGDTQFTIIKLSAAKQSYLKSIEVNDGDPTPHDRLGILYIALKQYDKAMKKFNDALSRDRNSVPALLRLGEFHYNLEKKDNALGKKDKAKIYFNNAIKIAPETSRAYVGLGAISNDNGDYAQALKHFTYALKLDPDNVALVQEINQIKKKLQ